MKRKVKRPFDNEQFRKGYVAGIFAAEKELNTKLLHFAEKAHKIMSEGTFPDYGVKINFKDSNNTIATNLDMKTEEKAKRYDEALEWMRELYPGLHGATKEDAEHYFPELKEKENEDERIRKAIVTLIEDLQHYSTNYAGVDPTDMLAYLEKQKVQKLITINQNEKEFLADEITAFLCNYDKEFDGEDPVPSEIAEHFYLLGKQAQEQKSVEWGDKDKEMLGKVLECIRFAEDRYQLEEEETNGVAVKSWLLEHIIPQPKQEQKPLEWSEEDEEMLTKLLDSISIGNNYKEMRNWLLLKLKSLSPQPKEEQEPEAKLTGWVARDSKYNSYFGLGLVLFKGKPRRSGECWSGAIAAQLPWEIFPEIKWEDEPAEVEIIIRKK